MAADPVRHGAADVLSFVVACLALAGTAWVLPGLTVDGLGPLVLGGALLAAANAASGLIGHWVFVRLPILVIQVAGLVVQFLVILIVGRVVPGVHVDDLATALEGALLLTLLNGFLADVVSVSDDDSYYSVLVRRLIARRGAATGSAGPGLLDRAARRGGAAGPGRGPASRPHAERRPDAAVRRRGPAFVADPAAAHDAGQPGRHPAREGRRDPRLPLVREGDRPRDGGQPSRGRQRRTGAHQRRPGPAGRRRGEHRQPVHRRRAPELPDDGHHPRGPAAGR